jgi:hypothetical protein
VGISKAITAYAGPKLVKAFEDYLSETPCLEFAFVHSTPAFGFLNHKQILHVRSPSAHNKLTVIDQKPHSLNEIIYYNIFKKTFIDLGLTSVVVPLIGTGAAGIALSECCANLAEALFKFAADFKAALDATAPKRLAIYIVNNDAAVLAQADSHISPKVYVLNKELRQKANLGSVKTEAINQETECCICLGPFLNSKTLAGCGHTFCTKCIDDHFRLAKQACPLCNKFYGQIIGPQPDGVMTSMVIDSAVPGYETESTRAIVITYNIPNGIQDARHPHPGAWFRGVHRVAYLPDTPKGREVLKLLEKAFESKLVFTVGKSRTTGHDNVVTWNDIHHKTRIDGGPTE